MYVAITRAKEKLWLTRSRSRYLYGRREPTMRSRFVEELKDELGIQDVRARYSGDFGYERRQSYNGYGSYGSRGNGSRTGDRISGEEGFTFGTAAKRPPALEPSRPQTPGGLQQTRSAATKSASGVELSRFTVGTKVRHPRFGTGVITARKNETTNLIVTVRFEVAGNKDLAAVLAPLTILE